MGAAAMAYMAFNNTINETQARLCPNGSCAENLTTDLIYATNAGGMIDMFLADSEAKDIANNTLGDISEATGADMSGL